MNTRNIKHACYKCEGRNHFNPDYEIRRAVFGISTTSKKFPCYPQCIYNIYCGPCAAEVYDAALRSGLYVKKRILMYLKR